MGFVPGDLLKEFMFDLQVCNKAYSVSSVLNIINFHLKKIYMQ